MKASVMYLIVCAASLAACAGRVDSDSNGSVGQNDTAPASSYTYCSPSKGPLTAAQVGPDAGDAILCPPPKIEGAILSATCTAQTSHVIAFGPDGQGIPPDASGPQFSCVITVPSGSTVGG